MQNNTLISVIVPCYNHGAYLPEALDAIISQTYPYWECIIVNDGSTDSTEAVAKKYCDKDSRFNYIYKKNGGLASSRNIGLKKATGSWIQFLDADDLIEPNKFQHQLNHIFQSKVSISICDYKRFKIEENKWTEEFYTSPRFITDPKSDLITRWEKGLCIPAHTVIFKRSLLKGELWFNENLTNHEDFVFWTVLFLGDPAVVFTDEVLCYYCNRSISLSSNKIKMRAGFLMAIQYLKKSIAASGKHAELMEALHLKEKEIRQKYSLYNPYSIKYWKRKLVRRIKLHVAG